MPESPLAKKMKLKPGFRANLLNAPEGYVKSLKPVPAGAEVLENARGEFDWVQVFVKNQAELAGILPRVLKSLNATGMVWFSFPKGTSKVQTDLTRDKGWGVLKDVDLKWITLISVDSTWSAFSMRRYRPGEAKQLLDW